MPGIATNTTQEFQKRLLEFNQKYINDWETWRNTEKENRPRRLGVILRKWQACRPNRMRRTRFESKHGCPYLEDLISDSEKFIQKINSFNICLKESFSDESLGALENLWKIFEDLSYYGKARNGRAGVVGISKAILLLTDGKVGPAFDSSVRKQLGIGAINSAEEWIKALKLASADIRAFEDKNNIKFRDAVQEKFIHLENGRIYDMALGPRPTVKKFIDN